MPILLKFTGVILMVQNISEYVTQIDKGRVAQITRFNTPTEP